MILSILHNSFKNVVAPLISDLYCTALINNLSSTVQEIVQSYIMMSFFYSFKLIQTLLDLGTAACCN